MSWGKGILAFYILFILITVSTAVFLINQKVDLVTDNYYEKELKYQEEIDKIKRTKNLSNKLSVVQENKILILKFPNLPDKNNTENFIILYRPSDDTKDKKIPIDTDSTGTQIIYTDKMQAGYYKIKANWVSSGDKYYDEIIINLP